MRRFTLLAMCVCVPQTFAALVTAGFIQVDNPALVSSGTFDLGGSNFHVTGSFGEGAWSTCLPCAVGSAVGTSGGVIGNDIFHGSGTLNGATFPSISWATLTGRVVNSERTEPTS